MLKVAFSLVIGSDRRWVEETASNTAPPAKVGAIPDPAASTKFIGGLSSLGPNPQTTFDGTHRSMPFVAVES